MANPPNDITVTRVEIDFGSTEPDYRTNMQPRFALTAVQDEATRNLQTVLFTVSVATNT